ncbi:hypothetical protein MKZ38_000146 [Zalerion maritima]|uniref:Uncharacterized protein n=1 Tax=Zalerion maritima TaxID=339359 RepID=A0AAD5RF78_9PEZI|nr:hypothetical protein MKZ38_000146 [Zalerion maritima]
MTNEEDESSNVLKHKGHLARGKDRNTQGSVSPEEKSAFMQTPPDTKPGNSSRSSKQPHQQSQQDHDYSTPLLHGPKHPHEVPAVEETTAENAAMVRAPQGVRRHSATDTR